MIETKRTYEEEDRFRLVGAMSGAVGIVGGSLLTWRSASQGGFGTISKAGVEYPAGKVALACGILAAIAVIALWRTHPRGGATATGALSLVALVAVGIEYFRIQAAISDAPEIVIASMGIGVWIALLGACLVLGASVWASEAFVRRLKAERQADPQQGQPAPTPASVPSGPPPGWFGDPAGGDSMRWWDGSCWTEHRLASTTSQDEPTRNDAATPLVPSPTTDPPSASEYRVPRV